MGEPLREIDVIFYDWTAQANDYVVFYDGPPVNNKVIGSWNVLAGQGRALRAARTEGMRQALMRCSPGNDLWINSTGVVTGIIGIEKN